MSSNLTKKQWQLCRRLSDRRRNVAATGFVAMTFTIIILGVGRTVDAFGIISMSSEKFSSYQPPVKTSVEQLQKFKSSSLSSNSKRISSSAGYPSSGDRSTAQSASASSLSVPAPPMSILEKGRNSFEQRMRDLVLGPPTTTKNTKRMSTDRRKDLDQSLSQTSSTSLQPNVQRIESLSDYKRIVGDEREKVVAVRFYASYCKACQAVAPHFYHLANQFPNTIFVDVPVTDRSTALHQGLGVPTLPYAHIYHPTGGLVEELKFTRNQVGAFKHKLSCYVEGRCMLDDNDDVRP